MSTATSTATANATVQDVLAIARLLPEAERQRLVELLNRGEDAPLPEQATIDEAIELYLADACSLGRAAELAGVTRWDVMDRMKECDIQIIITGHRTAEEIDTMAREWEHEGIL
jgi:hypothetical protein